MSMSDVTSVHGRRMLGNLPPMYQTSRVTKSKLQVEGAEIDTVYASISGVLDQFFVDTATWGLALWEDELGIVPPAGQPYSQRRSVIKSRLRGSGTVTVSLIKNVAESYDGGTVDVEMDAAVYSFTITFIDTRGIPPNLDNLKQAIEELKPAHLDVVYEFTYLNFGELESSGTTFGDLESSGMNFGELEAWRP